MNKHKATTLWVNNKLLDQDRIDPYFYKKEFIELDERINQLSFSNEKIGNLFKVTDGDHGSVELVDDGIPYLRAQNILEGYINLDNVVYISKEQDDKSKRSRITKNDILISIMASTGTSAIYNREFTSNANRAVGILRKMKDEIDEYYISCLINSSIGKKIFSRGIRGSIQKRLNLADVANIKVPYPSLKIQSYIGDKVRRAEDILDSVDNLRKEMVDTLYSEIGLPDVLDEKEEKFNFVLVDAIDDYRLDALFYLNKYIIYQNMLMEKKPAYLSDIIIESKYGASISADYHETGIPFLRGLNLDENKINDEIVYLHESVKSEIGKAFVNEGDILITRSGTVGVTAVVDKKHDGFAFGSFMIKLVVDKEKWNPYYISAFINSFWGEWQVERQKNGAVQQNINLQEIGRIMIPTLDLDKQRIFEKLIKEYIEKEKQAKQLIRQAIQDVEDLIEGNFDMSILDDSNAVSR